MLSIFTVTVSRAQTFSPQARQTMLLFWSDPHLRSDLEKLCVSYGALSVVRTEGMLYSAALVII